jgi:hypothetical protein
MTSLKEGWLLKPGTFGLKKRYFVVQQNLLLEFDR